MKKILEFLDEYGLLIILCLMLLFGAQQCSIKNKVKRETKYVKELVKEQERQDSVLTCSLETIEHKLDSTLISNNAVVNSNKATSNAISNQKQQQVVVKVVPQSANQ